MLYLTSKDDFNIDVVMDYCRSYNEVKKSRNTKIRETKEIDRVHKQENKEKKCTYCGYTHEIRKCPAYGKECNNCGDKNHFSTVCRNKGKKNRKNINVLDENNDSNDEDEADFFGECQENERKQDWTVKTHLPDGFQVNFKVDTFADVTIINSHTFDRLPNKPKFEKSPK